MRHDRQSAACHIKRKKNTSPNVISERDADTNRTISVTILASYIINGPHVVANPLVDKGKLS